MARWTSIEDLDLAALNAKLKAAGLSTVDSLRTYG
jgi:hypothetical protein